MTKNERIEVQKARNAMEVFNRTQDRQFLDFAAKTLAVLVRSASWKARKEIMAVADELGVRGLPEFIYNV